MPMEQLTSSYATKMDSKLSAALTDWWKGLSKEELLEYIAGQPSITADVLRELFSNSSSTLAFDIMFNTVSLAANTDFHTDGNAQ